MQGVDYHHWMERDNIEIVLNFCKFARAQLEVTYLFDDPCHLKKNVYYQNIVCPNPHVNCIVNQKHVKISAPGSKNLPG